MGKRQVDYKGRMNRKSNQKAKMIATLFTAATIVSSPITLHYDDLGRGLIVGNSQVDAATISLLGNSTLDASYVNGKLVIKLVGTQIANIGLLQHYYPYFKLPDELKSLLSNPNVKANTKIDYSIPYLGVLGASLSDNGTVTGNNLIVDPMAGTIGANVTHGLGVSVAGSTTFTLTIDLAALGVAALPSGVGDGRLDFYAMAGDNFIDVDLLNNSGARTFIEAPE
ncbi:hypothetical protein HCA15_14650, partial [Listeria booriae]|nr:hypothetical protein [Listeria booriae]